MSFNNSKRLNNNNSKFGNKEYNGVLNVSIIMIKAVNDIIPTKIKARNVL